MGRFLDTFAKATVGVRLVFLLAFLAVTIFNGIWWWHRFHLSAPYWLIFLWSMPWWPWLMPFADLMPPYLRSAVQATFVAFGFATNSSLAYILVRAAWLRLRPNNSFKPKPLRGSVANHTHPSHRRVAKMDTPEIRIGQLGIRYILDG